VEFFSVMVRHLDRSSSFFPFMNSASSNLAALKESNASTIVTAVNRAGCSGDAFTNPFFLLGARNNEFGHLP